MEKIILPEAGHLVETRARKMSDNVPYDSMADVFAFSGSAAGLDGLVTYLRDTASITRTSARCCCANDLSSACHSSIPAN